MGRSATEDWSAVGTFTFLCRTYESRCIRTCAVHVVNYLAAADLARIVMENIGAEV